MIFETILHNQKTISLFNYVIACVILYSCLKKRKTASNHKLLHKKLPKNFKLFLYLFRFALNNLPFNISSKILKISTL